MYCNFIFINFTIRKLNSKKMTTQVEVVNDFIESLKNVEFWREYICNDTGTGKGNVLEDMEEEILINGFLIINIENAVIQYEILEKSKEKNEFIEKFLNNFNFNMNKYRDWISESKETNKNLEMSILNLNTKNGECTTMF